MPCIDFLYHNDGSIVTLLPQTTEAEEWIDNNLPEETPRWGKGVAIEFNYADDIFYGIVTDGLTLQRYA